MSLSLSFFFFFFFCVCVCLFVRLFVCSLHSEFRGIFCSETNVNDHLPPEVMDLLPTLDDKTKLISAAYHSLNKSQNFCWVDRAMVYASICAVAPHVGHRISGWGEPLSVALLHYGAIFVQDHELRIRVSQTRIPAAVPRMLGSGPAATACQP